MSWWRALALTLTSMIAVGILVSGCLISFETERDASPTPAMTPIPTAESALPPSPIPTAAPTPSPSPTATPTPSPTPTPIPSPTPTPSPTPEPGSTVQFASRGGCCPLFSWFDSRNLLVFDAPPGESGGLWRYDVEFDAAARIGNGFGVVAASGIVAVPERSAGRVLILDIVGNVNHVVGNGGVVAWPSPGGARLAWLERLGIATPSSSVNRANRLWVSGIDGAAARPVLDLQAASVQWLPDERRVVVAARTLDASSAGIWLIDTETGGVVSLVDALFLQGVRVSPDGSRVAYLRTLAEDPSLNGLWVRTIDGDGVWSVPVAGSYRWHPNSASLWLLQTGWLDQPDRIVQIDIETGVEIAAMTIDGQVLNDAWEISPDGRRIAFWRVFDRQVVVQGFLPGAHAGGG